MRGLTYLFYAFAPLCGALLSFSHILQADCKYATQLAIDAYDLGTAEKTLARRKQWLQQAINICPGQADAHNLLADIYEHEKNYPLAIQHYQQALTIEPTFVEAWYGLGETYYKQQRFPLALEAYLKACAKDKDARDQVIRLMHSKRFRVTPDGTILDKQSLLLLFDQSRRAALKTSLKQCQLKAEIQPVFIFTNILFNSSQASLQAQSQTQIEAIAVALLEADETHIRISGHTDQQAFRNQTAQQSRYSNQRLSEQRAETVAGQLVSLGVYKGRIKSRGYGSSRPAERSNSANQANRRVEIEVVED